MSVEAMAIALHHSRATGSAKLVLVGIANHDSDGGAWPAMSTLANYAGVNLRNVHSAVEKLESLGEVSRALNGGGGRQTAAHMRTNLYKFLLVCPPNCDRTSAHRMLCQVCGKELPIARRRKLTHLACHPLSPATPPVAGDIPPLSPATYEPNLNPPTTDISDALVPNRASATASASTERQGRTTAASIASGDAGLAEGPRSLTEPLTAPSCLDSPTAPHTYTAEGECALCGPSARSNGLAQ